ncbi:DeoR/GlpR family DNA-binding transcription regulator [Gemelliphila palaticanis]|uniref:Lactose phosphotransferase system repressor n=1 Tax=Gemelliphila palaticanis TaxID=81950 RepID=A0ABX2SZS4_9BACL|nr:DeoR/GlpR family DNA-binding transcription regulator [Gemella palaticanis]MBF0715879.1 DeoR/GlpR transcriptional regulator [Gemella palaticanis]NYS47809.1 DeoR/GlpR transcriptional regulator [Gemella palaticanis]
MLKIDRHMYILDELEKKRLVKVSDLSKYMNVAEMTIRRDLKELEEFGQLTRVHGGAKYKPKNFYQEDNYNKKIYVNVLEKKEICKKAAATIKENETIFIGPGSTTVHLYDYIKDKHINIVTNSITVFEQFKESPNSDLIFVGGRYRAKTKGFVGYFTQETLSKISVNKAFVGVNGVDLENITISDEEEGKCNEIILNNATEKYVLADSTKFFTYAFYAFYKSYNLSAIITDSKLDESIKEQYKKIVKVI